MKKDIFVLCKIKSDYQRFHKIYHQSFLVLFYFYPEFRRLLYTRLKQGYIFKPLYYFTKLFPNYHNLYISCEEIGDGLFIQHGFSTIISCRHIGDNCWINQQVTIGHKGKDSPFIGNNVEIRSGAKIIGNVCVGDDVIVGANCVVVKDVPPHSVVVGIPAKVIKKREQLGEEWTNV